MLAASTRPSPTRRGKPHGSGVLNFTSGRAAMGRNTATSQLWKSQTRHSAPHGIEGQHIKKETAEPLSIASNSKARTLGPLLSLGAMPGVSQIPLSTIAARYLL